MVMSVSSCHLCPNSFLSSVFTNAPGVSTSRGNVHTLLDRVHSVPDKLKIASCHSSILSC